MNVKFASRAALPIVAAVVAILGMAAPAQAAGSGNIWRNAVTGMCLDSNSLGQVYTLACNNGRYQDWEALTTPAGALRHRNAVTGNCLTSLSNNVYGFPCDKVTPAGDMQLWWYRDGQLINALSGFCLDSNFQGHVYAGVCNGGLYQKWNLVSRP